MLGGGGDPCFLPQMKDSHLFYHKRTHLALYSTFTVQSLYQTFLCLAVISFTQFSLLSPFPFIPSFYTERWNWGDWIVPFFMQSPCVNKGRSSVKWILHLAVTECGERCGKPSGFHTILYLFQSHFPAIQTQTYPMWTALNRNRISGREKERKINRFFCLILK